MNLKKLVNKYRRTLIIVTHIVIIAASYLLAYYLRFEFSIPDQYHGLIGKTLPLVLVIKVVLFYTAGIFLGLWRYVSLSDVLQILKANTIASLALLVSVIFLFGAQGFPRSIFVLDWIICTILVCGIRIVTRILREHLRPSIPLKQRRVLIIGAGQAGIMVLKEARRDPGLGFNVVGFIDDDPAKRDSTIHGVKVLGNRLDIPAVVEMLSVDEILFAIPSARGQVIRDILTHCRIPNVKLKMIPGFQKILNGDLELKPREVNPEDLLGRQTVEVDQEGIRSYIRAKKVLVTGAGGSIGSALCRQICAYMPRQIILFDHNENNVYFLDAEFRSRYPEIDIRVVIGDIKEIGLLKNVFSTYRPHVIFHAAAHKHVPLMECNVAAAVKNNIIGTRNLIYAASHYRAERFVLISTDKAVNPTSIMGASKRIAEMILQAKSRKSATRFIAVRFGNVLGSDGSVIPLFKRQIEQGMPVTVTHPEAKRYFMTGQEAAELVLQAGAFGKNGEIFILDMGEQIRIADLAKNLIILSGLIPEKDIPIKFIGLRPGEKLEEEMFLDVELGKTTQHDKIHIVQPDDLDLKKLRVRVKQLETWANLMNERMLIKKIRELVPTYIPYDEKRF